MSDPEDELSARFEDRAPGEADKMDNTDGPHGANDTSDTDGTDTACQTDNTGGSDDTGETDATRDRRQMPMYLPEAKIEAMNRLYDRLDAGSKLADEGGIEKHKDFMETVVAFALDHEAELADRLGIETDE